VLYTGGEVFLSLGAARNT